METAMTDKFKNIEPEQITDSVFNLLAKDWMLITAGDKDKFNMMTASWGGFGVLWNKKIAWCVVRPQRYTYEFMESANVFTLSFFEEKYRKALELCGTRSGRDIDKMKAAGLTPLFTDLNGVCFSEARLVLECRKIYFQDIDPKHFLDASIDANYPQKDYHRMYLGEITSCRVKTVLGE